MTPQMGGMGSETMGLRCAGESRRPSPQRAGRGLYTGHVPKERLRYHLARLPKPLLVLRCSQT